MQNPAEEGKDRDAVVKYSISLFDGLHGQVKMELGTLGRVLQLSSILEKVGRTL